MYNGQDIFLLGGLFALHLGCVLFLGPVAVVFYCVLILILMVGRVEIRELGLGLIFFLLSGFFINEINGQEWWVNRIHFIQSILNQEIIKEAWLYYDISAIEAIIWGGFLGFLYPIFIELWKLSPTKKVYHKSGEEKSFDRLSFIDKIYIKLMNKHPPFVPGREASIIGYNKKSKKKIVIKDKDLNQHCLIAGTTGSGKTTTLKNIIESAIARKIPVIFIDGKGQNDLGQEVLNIAKKYNKKNWLFSMTTKSSKYNPFLSGGTTANRDKVIQLSDWSEEFYKVLAQGYFQLVLSIIEKTETPHNLENYVKYIQENNLNYLVRESVRLSLLNDDEGNKFLQSIHLQEEAIKHMPRLQSELSNLLSSEFGHNFGKGEVDDFSIPKVIETGGVAYFSLSALKFPDAANTVGKLILSDMRASLDPNKREKIILIIDEFSTVAGEQVLNLLNQARSYGLHVILSIQSVGDLGQKINKNPMLFIKQIFGNCNLFIVHRLNAPEDAELFASVFGTKPEILITSQIEDIGPSGLGSMRPDREFLAHPDMLKNLKTGHFFYLNKNDTKRHHVCLGVGRMGEDYV